MWKRPSTVWPSHGSAPSIISPPSSGQCAMATLGVSMAPQLAQARQLLSPPLAGDCARGRRPSDFCESRASSSRWRVSTMAPSMTIEPAASDVGAHCTVMRAEPRQHHRQEHHAGDIEQEHADGDPGDLASLARRAVAIDGDDERDGPGHLGDDDEDHRPRRRPERRHVAAARLPHLAADHPRRRAAHDAAGERERHRGRDQPAQPLHRRVRRGARNRGQLQEERGEGERAGDVGRLAERERARGLAVAGRRARRSERGGRRQAEVEQAEPARLGRPPLGQQRQRPEQEQQHDPDDGGHYRAGHWAHLLYTRSAAPVAVRRRGAWRRRACRRSANVTRRTRSSTAPSTTISPSRTAPTSVPLEEPRSTMR